MAYKQITSWNDLTNQLNNTLDIAIKNVLDRAIDRLLEFIENDVYSRRESDWYERTYDLLNRNNWRAKIDHRYNLITVNIHFNESGLSHDSSRGVLQHGTAGNELDFNGLAEILNNPSVMNFDCNLSNWGTYPRGSFWDDFEEWFRNNFGDMIAEESARLGLNII